MQISELEELQGRRAAPAHPGSKAQIQVANDAIIAQSLSEDQMQQRRSRNRSGERPVAFIADAVWGEVYFSGGIPTLWHRTFFSCCPCCLIGCKCFRQCCAHGQEVTTSMAPRRAWRQFWLSFATCLSILQIFFLVAMMLSEDGVVSMSVNAMIGPHPHKLSFAGAKNAARIRYKAEWWRLLSPVLLHSGVIHVLANVFIQLRFGVFLEVRWGHGPWLIIYLGAGLYSMLASCIFLPDTLTVGSSGAICGLIGAEFVFLLTTWRQTLPRDVAERNVQVASLIITVTLTAAISFAPMVDFAAHAGGFLVGALLGLILFADKMQDLAWRCVSWLAGIVLLGALLVGSVFYFVRNVFPDRQLLNLCSPAECG